MAYALSMIALEDRLERIHGFENMMVLLVVDHLCICQGQLDLAEDNLQSSVAYC